MKTGAQASRLHSNKLSGFVLAGGKSSRMKTDKAFLKFDGETFVGKAFKTLSPLCKTTKIVINREQKTKFAEAYPAFDFIFDVYPERGAVGGIHAALRNCETKFALILAVDLPLVTSETIEKLIQIASEHFSAFVPRQNDGRLQPLCALYRVEACLPKLEELLEKTDSASARDFLALVSPKIVEAASLSGNADVFFNVNDAQDFAGLSRSSTD
jgi:molybdopterin-guanine dinucleotide biosynthesis protein A